MNQAELEQFVAAAARAQGLVLDPEQMQRVTVAFARHAAIASLVLEFDLPASVEPAPVFAP
jgi:hypothetical protein